MSEWAVLFLAVEFIINEMDIQNLSHFLQIGIHSPKKCPYIAVCKKTNSRENAGVTLQLREHE